MILASQTEIFDTDVMGELNRLKIERIKSGSALLDLSMINPDMTPHRFLMDKLSEASINPAHHRYSVSRGIRKLRQAFADKYEQKFQATVDPETEICVTMGMKDALVNLLFCATRPGDTVLLGKPTYPAHLSACRLAGLNLDFFSIDSDPGTTLRNVQEKIQSSRPSVVLFNFPNNPTGISVSREFFQQVIAGFSASETLFVNDFVYGEMGFNGAPQPSLMSAPNASAKCVEIYSLSKAYCVPGWRIGALLGNPELVSKLARLKSHIDYGIFLPLQIAAAAALTCSSDLISGVVSEYHRRARDLTSGLQRLGWRVNAPQAGASVWASPPEAAASVDNGSFSLALARRLLLEHSVLVMPGCLFGSEFDSFVRFALVAGCPQIHQVVQRLEIMGAK
ncbi:MAG: aminotransferase class I/II-fold pyridoxal phosphate-dependent enzyme [Deltaproteobacteria bacterium]|nr:aminotransferase class I/II-fold pyridoxal phosphate-dependent enzyme [Deltaproteobacteria bacterium]